jgi:Asp-tRNA(Asn)/Glu-tRNA(Gln) amidotransferase C subunit
MSENKGVYQEGITRIDKAERESFVSLQELYFAIAEMLGVNNDEEMIAKIKQLIEFRDQVKELLFHNPLQESSETTIDKLKEVINSNSRLQEFWLTIMDLVGANLSSCHDSIDDFAIGKIKQLLAVKVDDVQITGNPSEVAEALRKEVEVYRESLSNEQTVIANLRHDLLVANKVIARLVGE